MNAQLTQGVRAARPVVTSRPFAAPCQAKRIACRATETNNAAPSDAVDFTELAEIVKLVNATDIVEMEMKGRRFNLTLKKKEALAKPEPIIQMMTAAPQGTSMAPAPAAPAPPATPAPPPPAPKAAAPPTVGGIEIRSPMSGTFYTAAAPGEPAFVKVGDKVKKGQTVGIIEAMKLMNEIEAEVSGEVIKMVAENGKPITSGQALMVIKA